MGMQFVDAQLTALLTSYGAGGIGWGAPLTFNLYTAAAAPPSHSSVIGDFTPASFAGYSSQAAAGFGGASMVGAQATITSTPLTWTSTDVVPQTILGYYVTDSGGNLIYAEQFTVPIVLVLLSPSLVLTPTIFLGNQ